VKISVGHPYRASDAPNVGELLGNCDFGTLHVEMWNDRTTVMLQYWRSFEHLHVCARMRDAEHLPAWAEFNCRIGSNGDLFTVTYTASEVTSDISV
jgi:hypothetical protein